MSIPVILVPPLLDSPPADRLRALVPFLRDGIDFATATTPGGALTFGVLARTPGNGRVVCEFDLPSFVTDMEAVFGEGDVLDAKAARIAAMLVGSS